MSQMPTVRLQNGILVANFSSGHDFQFDDGSVLEACDDERVKAGQLDINECISEIRKHEHESRITLCSLISLRVDLSRSAIVLLLSAQKQVREQRIDYVIVPLMFREALMRAYAKGLLEEDDVDRYVVIRKVGRDTAGERAKCCSQVFCL